MRNGLEPAWSQRFAWKWVPHGQRAAGLAMRRLSSIGGRLWIDLERSDPYWPAQLAALAAILLYLTLPNELTIGPTWLIPALEAALFIALLITTPGEEAPRTQVRQRLAWGLVAVLVAATLLGLALLAHLVVEEGTQAGGGLLRAAFVLWATIVLAFSLVYWELDRGGPVARAQPNPTQPADFLFTQNTAEGRELEPDWQPSFVDYLYLALTNSTAFGPTDTMPLRGRAKLTMGLQAGAAMITVGLLVASAIGNLQ